MSLGTKRKDPFDVLPYSIDWSAFLGADTIATSAWAAESGITIDGNSFTDTVTTVTLSGGAEGTAYVITNQITTAAGLSKDKDFTIKVTDDS